MAKIKRWEPFRELESFKRSMERLFDSFFGRYPLEEYEGFWTPPVDIEETENDVVVRIEIPGMKKDDIKIKTTGDSITISGEKRHESEEKGKHFHRIERAYGRFERTVPLPVEIEPDKARASYENGVLTVTLPKSEKAKAKEIEIEVK